MKQEELNKKIKSMFEYFWSLVGCGIMFLVMIPFIPLMIIGLLAIYILRLFLKK